MPTLEYAAVRIASPADIPAVKSVAELTWQDTYQDLLSRGAIDSFLQRAYSDYSLRQTLNGGGLWVLEHAGQIGGYVRLGIRDAVGDLNAIYVRPDLQGKGHGWRLWRCALAWFEARRVQMVHLTVAEANHKARSFYARLGFEEHDIRRSTLQGEALVERECVLVLPPPDLD